MNAAILAIGTELLGTHRIDSNSLYVTRAFEKHGVPLRRKVIIGDDFREVVSQVNELLAAHDILVISGGLGPTEDDLTKEAVAEALGLELELHEPTLHKIDALFTSRGMKMPEVNRKQAMVFRGQRTITNDRGTAPGFHLTVEIGGRPRHLWLFPGIPYELEGMVDNDLEPWLAQISGTRSTYRRAVKIAGMAESQVEEKLRPFYEKHRDRPVTVLAANYELQIHLQEEGDADDAYPRLTAAEEELRQIFGDAIFGLDDERLEDVVGRLLASRGETISTGESCTGGLLASRVTDVSGSSAYFLGGAVAYSQQAKLFLLGVDPNLIQTHGEVSEEVARDMAAGVRRRFGTTYGMAITGIAGPTGGTEKKPVGTVHVAVADIRETRHHHYRFVGSREMIKNWAVQMALNMLRLMIVRRSS